MKTGEYSNLASCILRVCGWSDVDVFMTLLEEKRKMSHSFHPEAKSLICTYFNLSPTEVDDMKVEEFLDYVAQVEAVAGKKIYNTRRDRIKNRLTGDPSSAHSMPPMVGGSRSTADAGIHQALQQAGMGNAYESLSSRIERETGAEPVPYEIALEHKGKRPDEHLAKGKIDKTVTWDKDRATFQNSKVWGDGPTV